MPFRGKKRKRKTANSVPNKKKKIVEKPSTSSIKIHCTMRNKSSRREAQISTDVTRIDNSHVTVKSENESSPSNSDPKITTDSNNAIEEKQMQIKNKLTSPGHSFIIILGDKLDEDTKAYHCVLCYQNSQRTGLQELIRHCKSKGHLLKIMELVNPKNAEFNPKKATINKIATILKDITGELDKDGVSFVTLSSFLSVRRNICKRIAALRKEEANGPAETKEDWAETLPKISSPSVQSPKDTSINHSSPSTGLRSSARNKINNTCSRDLKNFSVKEGKLSQAISQKGNSLTNEISPENPAKKICTHSEKIIFSADSGANNETEIKDLKVPSETPELKSRIEQISDNGNEMQTWSKSQKLPKSSPLTQFKTETSSVTEAKLITKTENINHITHDVVEEQKPLIDKSESSSKNLSLTKPESNTLNSEAEREITTAKSPSVPMKTKRLTPSVEKSVMKAEDKSEKQKPQSLTKNLVFKSEAAMESTAMKLTCKATHAEKKEQSQIKIVHNIINTSQQQKQVLNKLQPLSVVKSESNTPFSKISAKITVRKSESKNSKEMKEGNKKITKIVWDLDEKSAAKSDLHKLGEAKNEKQKIKKIVWDENKTIASKSETDKPNEAKKEKRKIEKIVWDEKVGSSKSESDKSSKVKNKNKVEKIILNEDNSKGKSSENDFKYFKILDELEKDVFKRYKNEIDKLVLLQRNRRPKKVIIVTDERDVFTEDEISSSDYQYRIIKDVNLTLGNLGEYLVPDSDFGSGVLFVILCGINSINQEQINHACLKTWCTTPSKYLNKTNDANLINKAIYAHKLILETTQNDTAIFAGLIPCSPKHFNLLSYQRRKCSKMHEAEPPSVLATAYNIHKLLLYNKFAELHSKLLGFPSLNLEDTFFVSPSYNKRLNYNFAALVDGYHFTDEFASSRKLTILKMCNKLMKILSQSENCVLNKEVLNKPNSGLKNDNRIGYRSQCEEAAARTIIRSERDRKEGERRSNSKTKTVIESRPRKSVESEVISSRASKFDKVVVLGNSRYKFYLEQLGGRKVYVMSDDISTDDLLNYIERKQPLLPPNTLWVLVTGIEFLFYKNDYELCLDYRCVNPLQATHSNYKVATVTKALNTLDEIVQALNIIERKVKSVLHSKSDFMLFPPIPPAMIIDSSVTHKDLHKLIVDHPKSYIVTDEMASYFSDIFENVSYTFTRLTWSALNSMGISPDPLEKYLTSRVNRIDTIYENVCLPPNKLTFYSEWLSIFRDIVSSCLGDYNYFASSDIQRCSMSSRKIIYIDNENEGTDYTSKTVLDKSKKKSLSPNKTVLDKSKKKSLSPSKTVLDKSKKKSLSDVKSYGKSVFSSSNKNMGEYGKIDSTKKDFVKSTSLVSECKGPYVTVAVRGSSQIKGKSVVDENGTSENLGNGIESSSTKEVKQSYSKSNKIKQNCNIYEIASDPRPLPFLECANSENKPENLSSCSDPDLLEQDLTSEIFDVEEDLESEFEEELCNEIFNNSDDDISVTSSSEDVNKLAHKTNNFSSVSEAVDKTYDHSLEQRWSEKTTKITKQDSHIGPSYSGINSKEDTEGLQMNKIPQNKERREINKNKTLTNQNLKIQKYGECHFIIYIANKHIINYLKSVNRIKDCSFWNIYFPINWTLLNTKISCLSPTKTYFFVIIADVTLITRFSPMKECSYRSCNSSLIVHYLDNTSDNLLNERLVEIKTLHERLTNIPNINTKVILAPCFPRKCLDFPSTILNFMPHELLHRAMSNKSEPCLLDGDIDSINEMALVLKRRWFNFAQDLYSSNDAKKYIPLEVFFYLPNSYSPINWTSISDVNFPFYVTHLWTKKLILMNYKIESYLKVPKSSSINKSDKKPLSLRADCEGKTSGKSNEENIITEKEIEHNSLLNSNFDSNENEEEFGSDWEDALLSEELEREILEAED